MNNQRGLLTLFLIVFATLLAGCSSAPGPEEIYQQYWDACSEGKFDEAEQFLSKNATQTAINLGSCALTHDAINTMQADSGQPLRTFSKDPDVTTKDNVSTIIWIDDQGNLAMITLVREDDTWKISQATWSR
jgi:hypothetical protein